MIENNFQANFITISITLVYYPSHMDILYDFLLL